jgi:hypothetical protein
MDQCQGRVARRTVSGEELEVIVKEVMTQPPEIIERLKNIKPNNGRNGKTDPLILLEKGARLRCTLRASAMRVIALFTL